LVPKPGTLTCPKTRNLNLLLCAYFLATLCSPLFYPRSFPNSWGYFVPTSWQLYAHLYFIRGPSQTP
ncbi:mCG140356, isoform CRA_a, partial [Mus musculus]